MVSPLPAWQDTAIMKCNFGTVKIANLFDLGLEPAILAVPFLPTSYLPHLAASNIKTITALAAMDAPALAAIIPDKDSDDILDDIITQARTIQGDYGLPNFDEDLEVIIAARAKHSGMSGPAIGKAMNLGMYDRNALLEIGGRNLKVIRSPKAIRRTRNTPSVTTNKPAGRTTQNNIKYNFGITRVSGLFDLGVAMDILALRSLPTSNRLKQLPKNNINSVQDIAQLSADELRNILQIENHPWIDNIIMEARAIAGGYDVSPLPPAYNKQDNVILRAHINGYSNLYISIRLDLEEEHIAQTVKRYQALPARQKNIRKTLAEAGRKNYTDEELAALYKKHGGSRIKIAEDLGIDPQNVTRALRIRGYPMDQKRVMKKYRPKHASRASKGKKAALG